MSTVHVDSAPGPDEPDDADERPILGRYRARTGTARSHRLTPRFNADELAEVRTAARRVGATPNGFVVQAAVAAARGSVMPVEDAEFQAELARLQRQLFQARTAVVRFGTNVNQAVAAFNSTGEAPAWLENAVALASRAVATLDEVIAKVDGRLR